MTDGDVATPVPAAWRAAHLVHQATVLGIAGVALLFATWDAPLYQAMLAGLPSLVLPPGIPIPLRFLGPLLVPIVLGVPLVFGRQRALVLLWVALMAVAAAIAVLEVSRLNWFAFVSGVAFRVESGPVPLVRTLAGAALLLCGVMLLGHQAVLRTVRDLATRGVPLPELRETRRRLLGFERTLVLGLFAAAVVLTLVAMVSMAATESAPEADEGWIVPVVWVAALLAVVVGALAYGLWHRSGSTGGEETRP